MSLLDRLKETVRASLHALERRVDYSAFYEARIVVQNADGSLELEAVDERVAKKLPPLSNVRIRYGVPGVKAKINAGGLALVGFANQSPKRAFALIVDDAAIETLILFDGTHPAAGQGDIVSVAFPPLMPFTGTYNGAPIAGNLVITTRGVGQIVTGRKRVLV